MKRRYCGPCDDYTNANPCKACGADTDLVCPACDREGATAGADISGEHNHGLPERMHRDTDCLAEEWVRDGRGLWAMRACHHLAHHGGRHLFGSWRYNVIPPAAPAPPSEVSRLRELQAMFVKCADAHRKRGDESKHDTAIADTWDAAAASLADRLDALAALSPAKEK